MKTITEILMEVYREGYRAGSMDADYKSIDAAEKYIGAVKARDAYVIGNPRMLKGNENNFDALKVTIQNLQITRQRRRAEESL